MPSAKNKRTKKISNKPANRLRRLQTEINRTERKLKKLLGRHSDGFKRWEQKKKSRKELDKTQGIMPNSKRHEALKNHISSLKNHLRKLGNK